ncbi:MAG: DUF5615 family PIN-like protein [Candidatus Heimdallarchaeota archaeon]
MRFLVDECTEPKVAKWLKEQRHKVYSVYDEVRGADDDSILKIANEKNYILITNDKDFGELITRLKKSHKGAILLKLEDERTENKIRVLQKLLKSQSKKLEGNFTIVTEKIIRIISEGKKSKIVIEKEK